MSDYDSRDFDQAADSPARIEHAETSAPERIEHAEISPAPERIDREIVVPASADELWRVITTDGWLADEVEVDLVPGGDARFVSRDSQRTGWVEEAKPPAQEGGPGRLVFWWAEDGEPASRVELILDPQEDRITRLRITETRPLEILDAVGIPLPGAGGSAHGPALLMAA